jgi:hypothetical protein
VLELLREVALETELAAAAASPGRPRVATEWLQQSPEAAFFINHVSN